MKNVITYLKTLWRRGLDSQSSDISLDCRLTVGSPSVKCGSTLMRLVAISAFLLTTGIGNVWGTEIYRNEGAAVSSGAGTTTSGTTATINKTAVNGNPAPSWGMTSNSKTTLTLSNFNVTNYSSRTLSVDAAFKSFPSTTNTWPYVTVTLYKNSVSVYTNSTTIKWSSKVTTYDTYTFENLPDFDKIVFVHSPAEGKSGAGKSTTSYACYLDNIIVSGTAAASCTTNPSVSAAGNSSVTSTTATLTCSSGITSLGSAGCSISSYGFVIGSSANPSIGGSGVTKHQVGTSYTTTGTSFSKDLTGLTPGATYYVRSYATNGNGDGYGTQTSFTMLNEYKLTFKEWDGGGTASGSPSTGTVIENATSFSFGATEPSKTGHTIEGFYTNTSASSGVKVANSSRQFIASVTDWTDGSSQYIGEDANLYIKWTPQTYTISSTLTGCSWETDIADASYEYTGDANAVSGTVNPTSGKGCPSSITVTMGGSTLTPSTDYTWSVSTAGVGTFLLKKVITGNVVVTITAQPMVKWMAGGQVFASKIGTAGTALTNPGTPSNVTYCDGTKVFVGWSATNIGATPTNTEPTDLFPSADATSLTIPAAGATYYAVFAAVTGTYGKFKRVTTSSASTDIAAGQQIAIVAYDDKKSSWHILGINAGGTAYDDASAPSETSSQIDTPAKRFIWTISKSGSYWIFTNKNTTSKKIAASTTTSNNTLNISTQTYDKWAYGTNTYGTNTFYLRQYGSSDLTANALERYNASWKIYAGSYTDGQAFQLKFYVPNYTASGYVTTCGTTYTVTKGTESGGTFTVSPTTAIEDATITLSATPSADYRFGSWAITNTSTAADVTSYVNLSGQTASATFDMPAYGVTVTPTFVAKCQTPTFSVSEGTYNNDQLVTITCATSSATIKYTTDGRDPATYGTTYSGPVTINTDNTTLKAVAIKASHENSEVASATYRLKCATPTFTASPGLQNSKYLGTQTVTPASTTTGSVTFYYTTDGGTPTTGSTEYEDGIEVSSTATVKAIATKSGYQNSDVGSASYTITPAYTVTWYNKGSQLTTTRVESGEKPVFPADSKSGCTPYTYFYGWAEADFTTPVTAPTTSSTIKVYRAASEMPAVSANKSYYAVWGDKVASVTHTLTLSSTWTGYDDGTLDDDQGATWSYYATGSTYDSKKWLGLNSNSNNYNIGSPTFSGNVQSIKAFIRNASSTETRYVYVCSSNGTAQPSSGDLGSCTVGRNNYQELTFTTSGSFKQFYLYTNAALSFYTITVVEGATDVKCVTNCCLDLDAINGDKTSLVYNGVTLTWTDIDHVSSWAVTGVDGEDNVVPAGNIGTPSSDGDTYSCAITGLSQYTDYTFTITPTPADGYCDASDEVTFKTPCVAPSSLSIAATGSKWDYCAGESMTLTVSGTNISASATYQWQKYDGSKWDDIDDATSASYTVASMAASNAGQYRCTVTNPGSSCDATTDGVWVRLWQLHLGDDNIDFTNSGTGTGENTAVHLNSDTHYEFKLIDNNGGWFGLNSKTVTTTESNITLNGTGANVNVTSGLEGNYTFAINYSDKNNPKVSITYPVANQANNRSIWFDKSVITGWTDAGTSDIFYRIGTSSGHTNNTKTGGTAWTLVPGTDKFYTTKTMAFDGFEVWQIANNIAWCDDSDDSHDIYVVKPNNPSTTDYDITRSIVHQKYVVGEGGVTLVPTTKKNTDSYGCDYWYVTKTDGMLKHTATISSYSHGSVTVSYNKYDGTGSASFTSGSNDDLAHRCILTITAVPDPGYNLTSLQVNSEDFDSGDDHILSDDATITAVFTAQTSAVTLKPNGGSGSDQMVTATYDAAMPGTLSGGGDIVKPSRDHYSFTGYFDNTSGGTQYYTSTLTSAKFWDKTGAQNLYAQWQGDSYTITFKDKGDNAYSGSNGGSLPTTHTYGAATDLVDGVKSGYRFDGWFDNSTCTGSAITSIGATDITTDKTYYAKWTIENYSVTWKVNGENYTTGTPSDNADYNTKVSTLPTAPSAPEGCSDKVFKGWSVINLGKTTGQDAPADLFTTAEGSPAITDDVIFYAVFADETPESSTTTWTKKTYTQLSEAGTYIIIDNADKAFTGSISSGKGSLTASAFSFTDGVATSVPDGAQELTFTMPTANQFTISKTVTEAGVPVTYYLYATAASSGKLAWTSTSGDLDGNYWTNKNTSGTVTTLFRYSKLYSDKYAHMRSNDNINTYGDAVSYSAVHFVKKGTAVTPASWSNYVTECDEPAECGTPTFSVDEGTYTEVQTVTISTVTDGATIRYTTDGTAPTSSSGTVYSEPIEIGCTTTLKAIAYKDGREDSEVGSVAITIKVPDPTFSVNSGTYYAVQNVTLSCDLDGATIYYETTNDGTDPTTPTSISTEYTGAINIPANSTIKVSAIAIKDGCATASDVVTKTYVVRIGTDYTLVTDVNDLNEGDKVVIIANTEDKHAINTYTTGANRPSTSDFDINGEKTVATIYPLKVGDTYTVQVLDLDGEPGAWVLKSGTSYLGLKADDSQLRTYVGNTTNETKWTISISSNLATITNKEYTGRSIQLNSSGSPFACYANGSQTAVKLYSVPTTDPVIKVEASLSAFTSCAGNAGTYQSFYVSGKNLTGNMVISGPTGYEFCSTSGGTYTTTLTLTPSTGAVARQLVYVRLAASATSGAHNGNINVAVSANSLSKNVAITGSATASDAYIDRIHGNSTTYYCGSYDAPDLSDETEETSGTCAEVHYKFMGWVAESDLTSLTSDGAYKTYLVKAGDDMTADGTTYYAVWGELE